MLKNVAIIKAKKSDKQVVKNLFQLYSYDFSEIYMDDVEESGLFTEYSYISSYFTDADRAVYLIRVDNKFAGFFMMNNYSLLSQNKVNSIAEFFIMRKYRKNGLGIYAANYIIDNYPGAMEISILKNNTRAHLFWDTAIKRRMIKRHTVTDASKDGVDWVIHSIFV